MKFKSEHGDINIESPDKVDTILCNEQGRLQKKIWNISVETRRIFEEILQKGYLIKGFYRKNDHNFYVAAK